MQLPCGKQTGFSGHAAWHTDSCESNSNISRNLGAMALHMQRNAQMGAAKAKLCSLLAIVGVFGL